MFLIVDMLPFLLTTMCLLIVISVLFFGNVACSSYICDAYDENKECPDENNEFYPYESISKIPLSLGDRMKFYENLSNDLIKIPYDCSFIIRLDGRSFTRFTRYLMTTLTKKYKNYNLPYSEDFKDAMYLTAHDLLHEFWSATAYTHSDEITLIFPARKSLKNGRPNEHLFNGRVDKLLSVIASFASSSFYQHIKNQLKTTNINDEYIESIHYQLSNPLTGTTKVPTFDARVIVFPREKSYEIVNHMLWRTNDCTKNFVSMYALKYLGKSVINKMSTRDRSDMLSVRGHDLTDDNIDKSMKHGVFMKSAHINDVENMNTEHFKKIIKTNFYVFPEFKFSSDMYQFLSTMHAPDSFEQYTVDFQTVFNTFGNYVTASPTTSSVSVSVSVSSRDTTDHSNEINGLSMLRQALEIDTVHHTCNDKCWADMVE